MEKELTEKQNKARRDFTNRHPLLGGLVNQILKTRVARTGQKSSTGLPDGQLSSLSSKSLRPVGGARIISSS